MTIQDDLARRWFQPAVPMEKPKNQPRLDPGPLTTRIVGELPVADARTPAHPQPAQLEVTQPYIPAIREQAPEFVKSLPADDPQRPVPEVPAVQEKTDPTALVAVPTTNGTAEATPPAPVKRRSLARRVIRRIIGPDLLRKDPPKRRR